MISKRICPVAGDSTADDDATLLVAEVRERQPELVDRARERLRERLAEAMDKLDADRVEQEIVIVATKLDVSEEMDRLDAHVSEVREAST